MQQFKFTEPPSVALDIETLSTRSDAAIISIAAKVFTFTDNPEIANTKDFTFNCLVNASSCAMYGMHFDMETVRWWQERMNDAKLPYTSLTGQDVPITKALGDFYIFVNQIRAMSPSGRILVWCQGTDFDIAILKTAFQNVFGYSEPWHRHELRDSRTFIHSVLGVLYPNVDDPYSLIPKDPGWVPHLPLSDVNHLIWNVTHVYQMLRDVLNRNNLCK